MKVGDRVKLIDTPAGWGYVSGVVIPHDDESDKFELNPGDVLVEWDNGDTCYERPTGLRLVIIHSHAFKPGARGDEGGCWHQDEPDDRGRGIRCGIYRQFHLP